MLRRRFLRPLGPSPRSLPAQSPAGRGATAGAAGSPLGPGPLPLPLGAAWLGARAPTRAEPIHGTLVAQLINAPSAGGAR